MNIFYTHKIFVHCVIMICKIHFRTNLYRKEKSIPSFVVNKKNNNFQRKNKKKKI